MIFTLADRRIDDQRLEIHGPEGPIAVEPRVLDTLLYLIRHRERVVSKAELIDKVWGAQHVSESAVARCVMEARRALGDDGSRRRLIKTAHGRGYRLVAPVVPVEDGGEGDGGGDAAPSGRSAVAVRVAAALAVIAVVALGAVAAWLGTRGPRPAAEAPVALALVSTAAGDAPDLGWLAVATEDQLRLGLEQAPGIELVEVPEGAPPAEELLAASGSAPRIDGVLGVSIAPSASEGYAVVESELVRRLDSGALEHAPMGRLVLPALDPAAEPERFASARETIVGSVIPLVVATLGRERSGDASRREAWQLYLRAVTRWQPACEAGAVEELVSRSLELDPSFAPAWILMAYVRLTQAKFCSGRAQSVAGVEEAIDRAAALDPESATPAALRATLRLYAGDTAGAYALLEQETERAPGELVTRLGRATALRYAGFVDDARRLYDEALASFPALPYVTGMLAYPYRYQGDWRGFLALASGQESPHFQFYRGLSHLMLDDRAAAARALAPAFETQPGDLYGRLCAALEAIVEGRDEEARVVLDQLARQRARQQALDGEVTFEIGQLMVLAGDAEGGLDQIGRAIDQGFFCAECIERDAGLAPLAGTPALRALLARARTRQDEFARRFDG